MERYSGPVSVSRALAAKLADINWLLPVLAASLALAGVAALYSTAGGRFDPWAGRHAARMCAGLALMLMVGLVPPRVWMRAANPLYLAVLAMVAAVPALGVSQLGARRWLGHGELSVQPAEFMQIAVILALARYYQWLGRDRIRSVVWLLPPLVMIGVPAALVLAEPDLGTALLMAATATVILFLSGIRTWVFVLGGALAGVAATLAWPHLQDYQRRRITTFLDPSLDPLGAGYHITQSKIALGSGGLHGTGFLGGTQSQLNFLPEKQTDFIFTMLAEETGFIGATVLLVLYAMLVGALLATALRARSTFARLITGGVAALIALHASVNIAMVTGLVPVVGVPLPFVSYGGTSLFTLMVGLGFVLSCSLHRDEPLRGASAGPFL